MFVVSYCLSVTYFAHDYDVKESKCWGALAFFNYVYSIVIIAREIIQCGIFFQVHPVFYNSGANSKYLGMLQESVLLRRIIVPVFQKLVEQRLNVLRDRLNFGSFGGILCGILAWLVILIPGYVICMTWVVGWAIILLLILVFDRFVFTNFLDFCDYVCPLFYIFGIYSSVEGDTLVMNETVKWSFLVCVMISGVRAFISFFFLFSSTRHFILLLIKCIEDMVPFTIIFFSAILVQSVFIIISSNHNPDVEEYMTVTDALKRGFEMSLVDNDLEKDFSLVYIVYIEGSVFLVIIMLNILIAIISDSFEQLYEIKAIQDAKAMASLLIEVSVFGTFFEDAWGNYHRYKYVEEADGEDEEEIQTRKWNGKIS